MHTPHDCSRRLLPLTAALAVLACAGSVPAQTPGGAEPERPRTAGAGLRIMTLNLAHGRGQAFHQALVGTEQVQRNLEAVARVVRREAPDVVALQEADGPSLWSGDLDHVAALATRAGMSHHYRGTHADGVWPVRLDYGTSLLARLPLRESRSESFDATWRDTKGFVIAAMEVPALGGAAVDVVSVHLDFLSADVRARQVQALAGALAARGRPVIVLGDMNCGLEELTCLPALMSKAGLSAWQAGAATFPADAPERRLDWILVSRQLELDAYVTLADQLSDHRGVVAEVSLRRERHATAAP